MNKDDNKVEFSTKKLDAISIYLTIGLSVVVGLLAAIPLYFFFGTAYSLLGFILAVIALVLTIFAYMLANVQKVPENHVWLIEFWGGFHVMWAAGGHFYFPLFGWIEMREEIFLGEEEIELFPSKNDLIDLDDTSCHFDAFLVIKAHDPYLAVYNIANFKEAVRIQVAGLLRSYLSKYTLDQANEKKLELDLPYIISEAKDGKDWKETAFYTNILNDWGVELCKMFVDDLDMSADDIAKRKLKQDAKIAEETAQNKKRVKIIEAQGDAAAIKLVAEAMQTKLQKEGLGIAQQIEALVKQGLTVEAATALVTDRYKWSQIGDKSLIIDGNAGAAGDGAKFGAGMKKSNEI